MIFQLEKNEILFPHPSLAEPDGLLAIGGDLSTERLVMAYRSGIFPWFSEQDPICWYAPHERCVIFPERVRVSHSMEKLIKSKRFEIRRDTAFAAVIENCSSISRKGQQGTWIVDAMISAYTKLHELGIAQSIEVWLDDELAGGMYGIKLGRIFCGESMFSKKSNASKLALIWLCRSGDYDLLDCQVPNDHLLSLGAEMIPQERFLQLLHAK